MSWNTSVVTNAGVGLLNESLAGHTLTIERAVGGAGTLEEEALKAAADVADPKQTFHLLGIEDVENGKRVGVQITNQGVAESYILHQIGVKARLEFQEPEEAALLFVLQDGRGVEIPSEAENPDFLFEIYGILTISNNANIEVRVDTGVVASVAYVDQIAAQKADLILSNLSNYQKALHNLGGRPSRNLLDNWYFVGGGSQQGGGQLPINQRGQTSYTAASANCIDRWKLFNSDTLALEADAIALTSCGTGTSQLRQILSAEAMEQIKGRTVTLSVLTTQGLFSGPFTISPDGSSISGEKISMENWYADLYANLSISKIEFRFVSLNPNATLKIRAVKLELGSIQTLACQDEAGGWQLFETPDYGAELAKCQRYLWSSNLGKRNYSCLGAGVAQSASILYLPVSLPVPMRENVDPTVSMQDQTHFRLRSSGGHYDDIVSSISYDGTNGSVVSVLLTGQFTQGQAYIVYTRNADALLLSCEL